MRKNLNFFFISVPFLTLLRGCFCAVHGRLAVRDAAPGPGEGGVLGLGEPEHLPLDPGVRRPRPAHSHRGHPLQQRLQRTRTLQQGYGQVLRFT
jgi:hypothetical protein